MKYSKFFFWIKSFFKTVLTLIISVVLCLFVAVLNVTAFPFEGEKEYYLSSASSQSLIKSNLSISDLPYLRGESVRVSYEGETDKVKQVYLCEILEKYRATIIKIEDYEDGTSYYCYSARFKQGVNVEGKTINLHIVMKEKEMAIGTPLIFGGY